MADFTLKKPAVKKQLLTRHFERYHQVCGSDATGPRSKKRKLDENDNQPKIQFKRRLKSSSIQKIKSAGLSLVTDMGMPIKTFENKVFKNFMATIFEEASVCGEEVDRLGLSARTLKRNMASNLKDNLELFKLGFLNLTF